jgi:hypothetical protein
MNLLSRVLDLSAPDHHAVERALELAAAAGLTTLEYSTRIVHGEPAQQSCCPNSEA